MKTLTDHERGKLRVRARTLFASLLLATAFSAAFTTSFAQNEVTQLTAAQNVEALTRPHRITATEGKRRVFVRSKSLLVRAAVVEDKLLKRPEFTQLGFVITRDEADADLILELRHDLLTKYVFSVVDVKTQTLLASGKVSSLGGTVGGKVAKRFVKEMARIPGP